VFLSSRLSHWASKSTSSSVIHFFPVSKLIACRGCFHLNAAGLRLIHRPDTATPAATGWTGGDCLLSEQQHGVSKESPKFLNSFNRSGDSTLLQGSRTISTPTEGPRLLASPFPRLGYSPRL